MNLVRWGIVGCGNVTEVKSGPGFQKADGSSLVVLDIDPRSPGFLGGALDTFKAPGRSGRSGSTGAAGPTSCCPADTAPSTSLPSACVDSDRAGRGSGTQGSRAGSSSRARDRGAVFSAGGDVTGQRRPAASTRQETEFSKEIGKQNAKDYGDLMKSGAMAQSKMTKLDRLSNLLSQSGATGKLTPASVELKAAAESLGFKVDPKLPFQQAAQALSNEIALELRNPSGGAGMPGALSDRDRVFLVSMVPNLGKTAEGNKLLIETMKRLAQREAQVAKMARDYKAKTGRFDEGFYQELAAFSESNPLFAQPSKSSGFSSPEAEAAYRKYGGK